MTPIARLASKGPPVTPPYVPGVQVPVTKRFTKLGMLVTSVIDVLANVPNAVLVKSRLVPVLMLNDTAPKV